MRKVVLVACLILVLIVGLAGALNRFVVIENKGSVVVAGVAVYKDSSCSEPLTVIDWGNVSPGSTATYNAWFRNEGNCNVTLSMHMENMVPANLSQYMCLSWSYDGSLLKPWEAKYVFFTLNVYENTSAITNFSFDIVVEAVESE